MHRNGLLFAFRSTNVKLEEDHIPIFDRVAFPFLSISPLRLDLLLRTHALQLVKTHNLGANKSSLEIGVDRPGRLRCFIPFTNAPSFHLVRSSREEINQMHHRKRRLDNLR